MVVKLRLLLTLLSFFAAILFLIFSYTVAKEMWQQFDFDATVRIQDRTPRTYDEIFSYFSLLASVEFSMAIIVVASGITLLKRKFWGFFSWYFIIPALVIEILGKLFIFHPGTPRFMHRTIIEADLPSFYIHTNFSYPSGHMLRTVFLAVVFSVLVVNSKVNLLVKCILLILSILVVAIMSFTRVYLGEHWFSDVIGGALLGLASGLFASAFLVSRNKTPDPL